MFYFCMGVSLLLLADSFQGLDRIQGKHGVSGHCRVDTPDLEPDFVLPSRSKVF